MDLTFAKEILSAIVLEQEKRLLRIIPTDKLINK